MYKKIKLKLKHRNGRSVRSAISGNYGKTRITCITPACTRGSAWNSTTMQCLPCPIGTYQPEPETDCESCPERLTTLHTGSTSILNCRTRKKLCLGVSLGICSSVFGCLMVVDSHRARELLPVPPPPTNIGNQF